MSLRRRSLLEVLAAFPLASGPVGAALAAEACEAPPAVDVRDNWEDDDGVIVMPTNPQRTSFRFCGDTITITKERFPSLVRSPKDGRPEFTEYVFDARRIVVADHLSLQTGRIRFIADELEFAPGGLITIAGQPPTGGSISDPSTLAGDDTSHGGDGVSIVARSVIFGDTVPHPLAFYLSGNDPARTAKVPTRRLSLIASSLVIRGSRIVPADAPDALGQLILNAVFEISGITPADCVPVVALDAIDTASTAQDLSASVYRTLFAKHALWPLAFAAKVKRVHAGAPFDAENRARLHSIIASASPWMEQWRSPGPLSQLHGIEAAIEAGLDGNGYSSRNVPRLALSQQITDLETRLTQLNPGEYVDLLEAQVLAIFDTQTLDQKVLGSIRSQQAALKANIDSVQADLGTSLTKLAELNQQIDSLCFLEQRAREAVQRKIDDLKQRNDTNWQIKQATNWVAMAASFVPVVGFAVSVGVEVAGTAIYRHNALPGDPSDGSYLVTLEQIFTQCQAFHQQANAASAAWSDFTKSGDAVLTSWSGPGSAASGLTRTAAPAPSSPPGPSKLAPKLAAAKDLAQKGRALYGSIDDLLRAASVPKPQQLQLNGMEADDPDMRALLAQHQEINARRGTVLTKIGDLKDQMLAAFNKLTEIASAESDMLMTDPVDDVSISRWANTALRLRSNVFADIYRDMALLKRAAFYANFSRSVLETDLQLPADPLSFQPPGGAANLSSAYDKAWLVESFRTQRQRIGTAISALVQLTKQQQKDYEASNLVRDYDTTSTPLSLPAATPRLTTEIQLTRAESASPEGLFVQALNNAIADRVRRRLKNDPPSESAPILLPIAWKSEAADALRFVIAGVTSLTFSNPAALGGSALNFRIYHPGHGRMARDAGCYQFDLRQGLSASSLADWRSETNIIAAELDKISSAEALKARQRELPDDAYFKVARLPLRTSYTMTVSVSGSVAGIDPAKPVALKSMVVTLIGIK